MSKDSLSPAQHRVLLLPGWRNSDNDHWQSRWEIRYGYERIQQHDWQRPLRGDWTTRLQETVSESDRPVVLVAHSLGCILVAWWAVHSPPASIRKVRGALLVAPGDVERDSLSETLIGWKPVLLKHLPFPSVLVGSRDDPYCHFDRAQIFAQASIRPVIWEIGMRDINNYNTLY